MIRKVEKIGPDKSLIELTKKIIEQNQTIIELNARIIYSLHHPPYIVQDSLAPEE